MAGKEKIAHFLEQYKKVQLTYKDFSSTVKFILETLLKNNGFHYQVVSPREKDPESLERKLRDKSNLQKIPLIELDDLAGCRVIFYLDSDIRRFIEYIYKEFTVIKNIPKFSTHDYNAHHLVVHLNKDRLNLTEYSKFMGLRCEIQLTTILYHAWSEIAHDISYKPPKKLPEFDPPAFESLKKQFQDVMQNHIMQVSYSFEFIHKQFEKLNQGKTVFDVQFLDGILKSASNNDLYERLSLLHQYVQEFGDKTPTKIDIITIVESALQKAKGSAPEPIKTVLGELKGKHYADIAEICLNILSELRYFHTERIFKLLIRLSSDANHTVKKKVVEILSKLASYNLYVLQKISYSPQLFILEQIEKWDDAKLIEHFEVITEIASQLLNPSCEGHSMTDYKTFTLRHGPLIVNEELINIRKDTLTILKKIFTLTSDLTLKKNILQVLNEATRTPTRGEYKDDMKQMILTGTNQLIDFYIKILPGSEYEVISAIEEQSHWFSQKFGDKDLPQVKTLKKLIATNPDYQVFRVFVGYDRDYLEERDWKKAAKLRREKIQDYITDISDKNFKDWQKRILAVINNYSSSQPGEYQYFSNIFLFGLGKQKPSIATKLIQQNEKELEPFLLPLIAGIWKSRSSKTARALVSKWIDSNKRLSICAELFEYVKEIDSQLLEKCFKKSRKGRDDNALNSIVNSIIANYPKCKDLKSLFIRSIKELTRNNNARWVNNIWSSPESIINSLDEKGYDVIIENLILIPRVDYHVEAILMPVAVKYPNKVINFFNKRVVERTKKENDFRYDAIPFDLHKINEPLQKHATVVISEIIKWYSQKQARFEWEASHLIRAIFPLFNKVLDKELIRLIKSKKEKNAEIVLSILRAYKGESFLHNVCKNFVKQSPYVKEFKDSLFNALSQTGVVSGEYGFVNTYKQKLEKIQSWKKDKSKVIKLFIKEYEDYLNKIIVYEQKRADEDLELRKREFGIPRA